MVVSLVEILGLKKMGGGSGCGQGLDVAPVVQHLPDVFFW